jgi:hypothetical protein
MVQLIYDYSTAAAHRLQIGLLLRELKDLWVTALVLAIAIVVRKQQQEFEAEEERECKCVSTKQETKIVPIDWIQIGSSLYTDIVYKFRLAECWNSVRPFFNGKELITLLHIPHGPLVGVYMDEQIKYRIQYPDSTREGCQHFYKKYRKYNHNKNMVQHHLPIKKIRT